MRVGLGLACYAVAYVVLDVMGLLSLLHVFNLIFIFGNWAVLKWRSRPDPSTGRRPQQLRLAPRGFAVRDGVGPVEFKPWNPRCRVHIHKTFAGEPEVVVEQPLFGPVVRERPLVFRPAPREINVVAKRIAALLEEANKK